MIPLSSSLGLSAFPRRSFAFVMLLCFLDLVSRLWTGPRELFLEMIAFHPNQSYPWLKILSATLFFPNLFSLSFHLFFFWAFAPLCSQRLGLFRFLSGLGLGTTVSACSFFWIHPEFQQAIVLPEALFATLLGMSMRHEIWGSTSTLVMGWRWVRVFEVPSYVLIFFYFFYLLIANLFLPKFYADTPMLYWIPFVAFLFGFVWAWPLFGKVGQDNPSVQS